MPREQCIASDEVKRILRRYGLKARKRLGQHFLIDTTYTGKIIEAAELSHEDTVIEVGPGLGILTRELIKSAKKVFAVELDNELALLLKRRLGSSGNLHVINEDILKVDLVQLLQDERCYKVVANLPYYITSPILHYFIDALLRPSRMVLMVQKEVGEAIAASPPNMSVLTVGVQIHSIPSIVAHLPADKFYPPPKVDSAIIRLDMRPAPLIRVENTEHFLALVRCGFNAPRKTLRNSLAQGLKRETAEITTLLNQAGISPQRRPETLTIAEWEHLYKIMLTTGEVMPAC